MYAQTAVKVRTGGKRGPRTTGSDDDLVAAIRVVLADTPFHGEGHRKVRVRLRAHGWRVGKNRVLHLLRLHRLLAPQRPGHPHGDPAHAGTITTERPNVMWGTDATRFYTERDGWCWFFGAIDHASDDIVGWHVAKIVDRWAALEPIHQGVREAFGAFGKDVRGPRDSERLGAAVCRGRVSQRVGLARHDPQSIVRRRTAMQWRDRALHADVERTMSVAPSVPLARRGPPRHRGVHRALQPPVVDRTTGASDTGDRASGDARGGPPDLSAAAV